MLLFRIDGSAMDYDANVRWTALMASKAHGAGAAVEAELGRLAGEEDGMSVPEVEARMTDPAQVRCCKRETPVLQFCVFTHDFGFSFPHEMHAVMESFGLELSCSSSCRSLSENKSGFL